MSVGSTGTSVAGNTLTLTCTATLLQPLTNTPSIQWVGPDGRRIENGAGVTVSDPIPLNASSMMVSVTYSPLRTSHGGEYRCVADVTIPQASLSITSSSALDITVQSESPQPHLTTVTNPTPPSPPVPPPTLTITGSPVDEGFHDGLNLTFTARAEFNPAVDTPLLVRGVWSKTNPFSDLTADDRVTIMDQEVVESGSDVYESTLTVDTLDVARGDSGDYTLSLDISSVPFTTGTNISTTRSITVLGEVV